MSIDLSKESEGEEPVCKNTVTPADFVDFNVVPDYGCSEEAPVCTNDDGFDIPSYV